MSTSADFLLSLIFQGDATPLADAVRQAIALSAQAGVQFGELVDRANQEILARTRATQGQLDRLQAQYDQTRLNNERTLQEKLQLLRTQGVSRATIQQDPLLSSVVSARGRLPELDTIISRVRNSLANTTGETQLAQSIAALRQEYESLFSELSKIAQISRAVTNAQNEETAAAKRRQAAVEEEARRQAAVNSTAGIRSDINSRGFDPNLNLAGQTTAELQQARRNIRRIGAGIAEDIARVRTAIQQAGRGKSPELDYLRNLLANLEGQRRQIQARMAEIGEALSAKRGSVRSGLDRLLDYAKFVLITGAVYRLGSAFRSVTKDVIETAGEFQRLQTSFVSILAEPLLEQKKREGKSVALSAQDIQSLRVESARLFQESQKAAIQTVATTKEYVQVLQTALAVGQSVGLTQQEIAIITKRLVLAAGAFGIEFDKVGTSIAQIFSGTVRATNQLGRNLGLATAKQRELLKAAIENGRLFEFLDAKTKAFGDTAKIVEDNFLNVKAAIIDIFQFGGTQAIQPLFRLLNEELIKFRDRYIGTTENALIKPALQRIIDQVQGFLLAIIPSIKAFANEVGLLVGEITRSLFGSGGQSTIKDLFKLATAIVHAFRDAVSVAGSVLDVLGGWGSKLNLTLLTIGLLIKMFTQMSLLSAKVREDAKLIGKAQFRGGTGAEGVGFLATGGRILGVVGKTLGILGLLVTALTLVKDLYDEFSGSADRARKSLEDFNLAAQRQADLLDSRLKSQALLDLVDTYRELAGQTGLNKEQQEELAKAYNILAAAIGKTNLEAIKSGDLTASALGSIRTAIKQTVDDASKFIDKLDEAAKAPAKIRELQGQISSLTSPVTVGTGLNSEEISKASVELEKQEAILQEAAKAFGLNKDAILDNDDVLQAFLKHIEESRDKYQKFIDAQRLATKTSAELNGWLFSLTKQIADLNKEKNETSDFAETQRLLNLITQLENQQAQVSAAFIRQLKLEAQTHKQSVQTYIDAQIALLTSERAYAEKFSMVGRIEELTDLIERLNEAKAQLTPADGSNKKEKKVRERDELSDFIKEVERQLSVLKNLNELLQGEIDRTAELRLKAVKQLGESGALSAEETLRLQEEILGGQDALKNQLVAIQQLYVAVAGKTAQPIAQRQQGRDDKKDKSSTDNRDRSLETRIRFLNDSLELLRKGVDEFRKHEEKLTQAAEDFITRRISERKAELSFLDEYIKRSTDAAIKIADIQDQLGLIGSAEAFAIKRQLAQGNRESERARLINELNPILDPEFQVQVKTAVDKAIAVLSTDQGAGPFSNLRVALLKLKHDFLDGGILDPEQAEAFRRTLPDTLRDFLGDSTQLSQFDGLVAEYDRLAQKLIGINRNLGKGQAVSKAEQDSILLRQKEITEQITKQFGVRIDDKAIVNLAAARKLLEQANLPLERKLELTKQLTALEEAEREAALEAFVVEHKLQLEQLDLQRTILDFDLKRLDTIADLIDKQKEAGVLTQNEANIRLRIVEAQRIQNLEAQRSAALQKLQTATANLKGSVLANPAVAQQQLQAAQELRDLSQALLEVKLRAHDANSRLKATGEAFSEIADAVNELPEPFNKLGGIFTALAKVANNLDARSKRSIFEQAEQAARTAAQAFEQAGRKFPDELNPLIKRYSEAVDDSTRAIRRALKDDPGSFTNVIKKAAEDFRRIILGDQSSVTGSQSNGDDLPVVPNRIGTLDNAAGDVEHDATVAVGQIATVQIDAAKDEVIQATRGAAGTGIGAKAKEALGFLTADLIRNIGGVVAASIRTLGASDAGGRVSGIGGIIGSLGGFFKAGSAAAKALPIVGGAIEAVGSIISFFGARARAKTHEMAETITKGINELRDQIGSGAIGLGEGIRQLRLKFEDARRHLSGRKGGKEELAKIEEQTNAEIKQLQEQAKRIQDNYRKQLALLKKPADLRDTAQKIQSLIDQTKEFIDSFENIGDLEQAAKDSMEFIQLSIKELKDEISKNLSDLQKQLQDAGEDFRRSERDILLRGRIDPQVSEIENKRRELVDLERSFREKQKEIADQIAAEKRKFAYVNERGNAEKIIADLMGHSASQMSQAARDMQSAAQVWERVFGKGVLPSLNTQQLFSGLRTSQQQNGLGALALSVDVRVDGRPARPGEVTIGVKQADQIRIGNRINRFDPRLVPVI